MDIDLDAHYTVPSAFGGGIAFYLLGPVMHRDEDWEWTGIDTPDENMVRAVMVGDDTVHEVDKDRPR